MSQELCKDNQNFLKNRLLTIDADNFEQIKSTINQLIAEGWDINFVIPKASAYCASILHCLVDLRELYLIKWFCDTFISLNLNIQSLSTQNGYTPLHLAIEYNVFNIIEYLVSKNVDGSIRTKQGETIFHLAIKYANNAVFNFLKNRFADKFAANAVNNDKETLCDYAMKNTHIDTGILATFLSIKYDFNVPNQRGEMPLFLAVQNLNTSALEYLIKSDECNVNVTDSVGNNLLHCAIKSKGACFIDFLLKNGCDCNVKNQAGQTPLMLAVEYNSSVSINALVPYDKNYNNFDYIQGNNILHYAVTKCNDNESIVKAMLTGNFLNLNAKNNKGFTALFLSIIHRKSRVFQYLISLPEIDFSILDNDLNTVLHHFISVSGDVNIIEKLLNKGCNIYAKNQQEITPLDLCFEYKRKNVIQFLIQKNYCNINADEIDILMNDIKYVFNNAVRKEIKIYNFLKFDGLFDKNYDINQQNDEGNTALHMAISMKYYSRFGRTTKEVKIDKMQTYTKVINFIMSNPALNLKTRNHSFKTAFDLAIEYNDKDTLDLIFDKAQTAGQYDEVQHEEQSEDWYEESLEESATDFPEFDDSVYDFYDLSFCDPTKHSAIDVERQKNQFIRSFNLAIKYNFVLAVEYFLVKNLIDINMQDMQGNTPLLNALWNFRNAEIIELLLSVVDINLNIVNMFGHTPLHCLAYTGYFEFLNTLITRGCKINATDKKGYTPLEWLYMRIPQGTDEKNAKIQGIQKMLAYKAVGDKELNNLSDIAFDDYVQNKII